MAVLQVDLATWEGVCVCVHERGKERERDGKEG